MLRLQNQQESLAFSELPLLARHLEFECPLCRTSTNFIGLLPGPAPVVHHPDDVPLVEQLQHLRTHIEQAREVASTRAVDLLMVNERKLEQQVLKLVLATPRDSDPCPAVSIPGLDAAVGTPAHTRAYDAVQMSLCSTLYQTMRSPDALGMQAQDQQLWQVAGNTLSALELRLRLDHTTDVPTNIFRNVSRMYKAAVMATRVLDRSGNTANLLSSLHHIVRDETTTSLREALLDPIRVAVSWLYVSTSPLGEPLAWQAVVNLCFALALFRNTWLLVTQPTVLIATREETYTAADCQAVQALVNLVAAKTNGGEPTPTVTSTAVDRITGAIVPLLRQLVLLQAAHSNTIVSTLTDSYHDLAASLSLPSLSSLVALMTEASVGPGNLWHTATTTWLESSRKRLNPTDLIYPRLNTSFITLPTEYNDLFSLIKSTTCPTLNSPTKYPALCLLCGAVCCFQAPCCATRVQVEDRPATPVGGTWLHARSCGRGSCMFLLINKATILMLHGRYGSYLPPPYVDEHGETNFGARRSVRTTLDNTRLQQLVQIWRHHGLQREVNLFHETRRLTPQDWQFS
eukprot:m.247808 g.247808  ORF g.247808 m.247808 type:complete len:572 (-) comp17493_c0_seq2:22-1737(-)